MTMTLDELAGAVHRLPSADAACARRRLATEFGSARDGTASWATLAHRQRVSLARLWATIAGHDTVLVTWTEAADTVDQPGVRRFGPTPVLALATADLERGVDWLPEELVVFDETFSWAAVFTAHVDVDGPMLYLARPVLSER